MRQRLQKILSAAGLCSRRQAEAYLREGKVTVNGAAAALGDSADPDSDEIALCGRQIPAQRQGVYLLLNKPRGYVTTLSDEKGRPTVADLTADCGCRVYPVGRLDMDSEGLLLLTNDGAFAQGLAHPSHEMEKEYLVWVSGATEGCRERLSSLTALEDGSAIRPAAVTVVSREANACLISVIIHQGLNRQVRRMCALAGLRVHQLRRVREGSLSLGELPVGHWRYLSADEVRQLLA